MQHGCFAIAAFGGEKASQPDCSAKGCRLQPGGRFTQSQNSNFNFHQTLCTAFNLRRFVLQLPFAYRHSCGGVTQCFALDQQSGDFDTVQS